MSEAQLREAAREWLISKDIRYQSETFLPGDVDSLTQLLEAARLEEHALSCVYCHLGDFSGCDRGRALTSRAAGDGKL